MTIANKAKQKLKHVRSNSVATHEVRQKAPRSRGLRRSLSSLARDPERTIITSLFLGGNPSEENFQKRKKTFGEKFLKALGLHHWAFIFVTVGYALIGGAVFHAVERPEEKNHNFFNELKAERNAQQLARRIAALLNADTANVSDVANEIKSFYKAIGNWPAKTTHWDYWGSVFFAGTIFSTIGYGNYSPITPVGRAVTMIYALIGIPLMLATLSDLGKLMMRNIKGPYAAAARTIERMRSREGAHKTSDDTEYEVPLWLGLILCGIWVIVCAAIYCNFVEKEWTFFTAVYFFVISCTTIGLGDVTPTASGETMILCPILIIVGLALISMCLNILAKRVEQIRNETTDLLEEKFKIDIDTESEDDEYYSKPPVQSTEDVQEPTQNKVTLGVIGNSPPPNFTSTPVQPRAPATIDLPRLRENSAKSQS